MTTAVAYIPNDAVPELVLAAYVRQFTRAPATEDKACFLHSPNARRIDLMCSNSGGELPRKTRDDLTQAFYAASKDYTPTAKESPAQAPSAPVSAPAAPLRPPPLTPIGAWAS